MAAASRSISKSGCSSSRCTGYACPATVPLAEDIVAVASRRLADIDLTDERSVSAAVRDAVAALQPVTRPPR